MIEGVANEVLLFSTVCALISGAFFWKAQQQNTAAAGAERDRAAAAPDEPDEEEITVTVRMASVAAQDLSFRMAPSASVSALKSSCRGRLDIPPTKDIRLIRMGRELTESQPIRELAEGQQSVLIHGTVFTPGQAPTGTQGLPFDSSVVLLSLGGGFIALMWWLLLTRGSSGFSGLAIGCLCIITIIYALFAMSRYGLH